MFLLLATLVASLMILAAFAVNLYSVKTLDPARRILFLFTSTVFAFILFNLLAFSSLGRQDTIVHIGLILGVPICGLVVSCATFLLGLIFDALSRPR